VCLAEMGECAAAPSEFVWQNWGDMSDVLDWLEDAASALASASEETAESFQDNLSDVWTAGVFVTYLALAAALAVLSRRESPPRLRLGSEVATAVAALALATLGGATFRWTFALPGLWLVIVGALSLWGGEIHERFIAQRRVARIWLPSWIIGPTGTRNAVEVGF